jgi:hypothetical protein
MIIQKTETTTPENQKNNRLKRNINTMTSKPDILTIYILVSLLLLTSCKKTNDNPTGNYQVLSVEENSISGTFVGQVLAHDDDGEGLSFSIRDGNKDDAFAISEKEGIITVQSEDPIDYETNPSFTLSVEIRDNRSRSIISTIYIKVINKNPPATGLLLYLPFNGSTSDLSGNRNNATDYTSHKYIQGRRSLALDFNGKSDYLQLKYSVNSGYGLSFSFWLKTRGANGTENNGAIVSKYNMSKQTRSFMIWSFGSYDTRSDNRLAAAFYKYGTSSGIHDHVKSYMEPGELTVFPNPALWTISNPLRLTPDTWTYCVINVTISTIETWINGVLCVKKLREYSTYFDSNNEPVMIGNNYAIGEGSNNHFNGTLDELRIYNRGLTNDEIRTLFKE